MPCATQGPDHEEVLPIAEDLGKALAESGYIVLTGGRSRGVMDAASRGAKVCRCAHARYLHRQPPQLDHMVGLVCLYALLAVGGRLHSGHHSWR
jgi:hypothetical protein